MAQLTAVLSADTTQFKKSLEDAKRILNEYKSSASKSSSEISKNASVTDQQVAAYNRVVKVFEKVQSGSMSTTQAEKALTNQIKELKIQWANLSAEAKKSDFGKQLANSCKTAEREVNQLRTQLSQVKGEVENVKKAAKSGFNFNVSGSISQLAGMTLGIGSATAAVGLAISAIKQGIKTVSDFNSAQSTLQAVTGKSASELAILTEQAKELGAATRYSASEIAGLQIELAKLGFDPTQIKAMTEHVQNFATATGTDLASAASLAGATLRMFEMDAEDTQRVADVLSASCSKSALSFEYLNAGMSTIGPVANAFGMKLEDVVGLLGMLANAGFDASSASTAARNIILNLADANGKLAVALGQPVTSGKELLSALIELREKGIDLGEALELTDKRSVAAFNTLLSGAETGKELITALEGCTGAAKEMSDVMSDNLEGDLAALNSAWEGLMIALGEGQGGIRAIIKELTDWLQQIQKNDEAMKDIQKTITVFVTALQILCGALIETVELVSHLVQACISLINLDFGAFADNIGAAFGDIMDFFDKTIPPLENLGNKLEEIDKKKKEVLGDSSSTTTVTAKVETETTTPKTTPTKTTTPKPTKTPKKSSSSNKVDYKEGSLGKLDQQIQDTQKKIKLTVDDESRQKFQRELDELTKKKQQLELDLKYPEGSLERLNKEISSKQAELKLAVNDQERLKIQKEIEDLVKEKDNIELRIKPTIDKEGLDKLKSDIEKSTNKSNNAIKIQTAPTSQMEVATGNMNDLKEQVDLQQSIVDKLQQQVDLIQKKASIGGGLTGEEKEVLSIYDATANKLQTLQEQYKETAASVQELTYAQQEQAALQDAYDGINEGLAEFGSYINELQSAIETFSDESADGFDKIAAGFQLLADTANAVVQVIQTVQAVTQAFAAANAVASKKNAASAQQETGANIGKAISGGAAAMGEAASSGASMPFPLNIAAIAAGVAAVAAVIATIFSLIGSFADGGIVKGATSLGDMNLARVNSGEMILNNSQQANLFKLLNGKTRLEENASSVSGAVEFKIKGDTLIGVQENYYRKQDRL